MKILIVDDELHALNNLKVRLQNIDANASILLANTVHEAKDMLRSVDIDILFLDIEMPEENGFNLLKSLENINFEIVFVTAYVDYALEAFQYFAIGYILKPIDQSCLIKIYKKVVRNVVANQQESTNQNIQQLLSFLKQDKIFAIPIVGGVEFIETKEIIRLEASSGYTIIHMLDGSKVCTSKRFNFFEGDMESSQFIRIHRSHIVNMGYVKSYKKNGTITLRDLTVLPVGAQYRINLQSVIPHL